jgi:hypothetical protein
MPDAGISLWRRRKAVDPCHKGTGRASAGRAIRAHALNCPVEARPPQLLRRGQLRADPVPDLVPERPQRLDRPDHNLEFAGLPVETKRCKPVRLCCGNGASAYLSVIIVHPAGHNP